MRHLLILLLLSLPLHSLAQILTGNVVDQDGRGIANASLYVTQLRQGFVADADGCFCAALVAGDYDCEVSSLGYQKQTVPISIDSDTTTVRIVLQEQSYLLGEVTVNASGEDPAMDIMRNVVARAAVLSAQPDTFLAETYVKGRGKFKKIPKLLGKAVAEDQMTREMMSNPFILEKVSRISYKAPDRTKEEVEAFKSTFPEAFEGDEIHVALTDYYANSLFGCVSPVRGNVFSYYTYHLVGSYEEGGRVVHHISLVPKKNMEGLLSGTLCIVDSLWCLSAVELHTSLPVGSLDVSASFSEAAKGTYLVSSQSVSCEMGMMGFVIEASYLLSVNYIHVGTNGNPGKAVSSTATPKDKPGRKAAKLQAEVAALQSDGKLDNRKAMRIAQLTEKLMEIDARSSGNLLRHELPSTLERHESRVDSLAKRRDESYWADKRMTSLEADEEASYAIAEKWRSRMDNIASSNQEDDWGERAMAFVFDGITWENKEKTRWVATKGLTEILPAYNLVDGFWAGLSAKGGMKIGKKLILTAHAKAYYLTERKACAWAAGFAIDYAPLLRGRLQLEGGQTSADFNGENPESNFAIALASALFARNDVKFYERSYGSIIHRIELVNGLVVTTGAEVERRKVLNNGQNHSWFKQTAQPNVPDNPLYSAMPRHMALLFTVSASYTPVHWFVRRDGWKRHTGSDWPTFTMTYRKALPLDNLSPDYHRIALAIDHEARIAHFHRLNWSMEAGTYLDAKRMFFSDMKHFDATTFPVTGRAMDASYALAGNYEWTTDTRWLQAAAAWHTPRLVFNWLPFMRKAMLDEALHVRGLVVKGSKPYWETGYSLGFGTKARAGVFVSFLGKRWRDVGFSLSVPIIGKWTSLGNRL